MASLLSLALHGKLEYLTDIVRTLLGDLAAHYVQKNPKLMLRRLALAWPVPAAGELAPSSLVLACVGLGSPGRRAGSGAAGGEADGHPERRAGHKGWPGGAALPSRYRLPQPGDRVALQQPL